MGTDILMIFIGIALVIMAIYVIVIRENASNEERARVEPTLYASAGEVVTCTNGHEICEIAKSIFVADLISVNQFINWRHQPQPQPRDPITPCMTCGAPYIQSDSGMAAMRLHINGEWRTTFNDEAT